MTGSKLKFFVLGCLVFAGVAHRDCAWAGPSGVISKAVQAEEAVQLLGKGEKIISSMVSDLKAETVAEIQKAHAPFIDKASAETLEKMKQDIVKALGDDQSVQKLRLEPAEVKDLSDEIIRMLDEKQMATLGNVREQIQHYLAKRYVMAARSSEGATVKSAVVAEPAIKKLERRLEQMEILFEPHLNIPQGPPRASLTVYPHGDREAKIVAEEFAKANIPIENFKAVKSDPVGERQIRLIETDQQRVKNQMDKISKGIADKKAELEDEEQTRIMKFVPPKRKWVLPKVTTPPVRATK